MLAMTAATYQTSDHCLSYNKDIMSEQTKRLKGFHQTLNTKSECLIRVFADKVHIRV